MENFSIIGKLAKSKTVEFAAWKSINISDYESFIMIQPNEVFMILEKTKDDAIEDPENMLKILYKGQILFIYFDLEKQDLIYI